MEVTLSRTIVLVILVTVAVLHSVLGELRLLRPLFSAPLPRAVLPLGRAFTERTLRFAWHLLSVAWLALAWIVARSDQGTLDIVGYMLLVSGGLALVTSRGETLRVGALRGGRSGGTPRAAHRGGRPGGRCARGGRALGDRGAACGVGARPKMGNSCGDT